MILVDTSVWISVLRADPDDYSARFRDAVRTGDVIVGDLILMEVLRGTRSEVDAERVRQQMAAFPVVSLGGQQMAEKAASNYRALRARGVTIRSSIDVFIATFCLEGGHALLHKDRDFTHFGLLGLQSY